MFSVLVARYKFPQSIAALAELGHVDLWPRFLGHQCMSQMKSAMFALGHLQLEHVTPVGECIQLSESCSWLLPTIQLQIHEVLTMHQNLGMCEAWGHYSCISHDRIAR